MDYQKGFIIILLQVLINLLDHTIAQTPLYHFCISKANYTQNSAYQTNLNTLLSSLSSNVSTYGFYSGSFGQNSDRVNAIVMCRGDIQLDPCRACIDNSTRMLVQRCPNQKEAVIYYDSCTLRYSNNFIDGIMTTSPTFWLRSNTNVTSKEKFNQDLRILLDSLRGRAAYGGPNRKFATGNRTAPDFKTIYALEQCVPNISGDDCSNCLIKAAEQISICCNGKKGMRIIGPSCYLRYEIGSFFKEVISDVAAQPPIGKFPIAQSDSGGDDSSTSIIIILVVSVFGSLMLIICICLIIKKQKQRRKKQKISHRVDATEDISTVESLQNDFNTVKAATNDFSDANKLGHGGFGVVYKGELSNGQEIAVKRLSRGSGQGDLEFKNEIMLMAKLQHRNLVRLLGFCLEDSERILIYEFMPNASLDQLIFDPVKRTDLDWDRRYKIIGGVAKGILYLHEDSRLRIIHRDLKASNVLLDEEMNAKIADFGMARLFEPEETHGNTNRIVGTYGYMAPEYVMYGQFSVKSDVFSFGVLVLEIVSGKKYNYSRDGEHVENLPSYAWKNWRDGTPANLIDPILKARSGSMRDIIRCIHIALLCVQESVTDRPTIAAVLLMINSLSFTLPVPSEPAFLMNVRLASEILRLDEENDTRMLESGQLLESRSVNEASITELYPR